MSRLTTKINEGIMYAINGDLTNYLKNCYMIAGDSINKLGQIEDIEEELGIDLITLFKALKKGIYVKDGKISYKMNFVMLGACDDGDERLFDWDDSNEKSFLIKDYGKTWALTKEELENEEL